MTLEAFRVLVHEVRTRVDKAPVRAGVYEAIVGELRLACFTVDHAASFDECRSGLTRSVLELALRNVLARRELAVAHDSARRALRCTLAVGDERDVQVPDPAPVSDVDVAGVDLAIVHLADALAIVNAMVAFTAGGGDYPKASTVQRLVAKLEGIRSILQRLHDGRAA